MPDGLIGATINVPGVRILSIIRAPVDIAGAVGDIDKVPVFEGVQYQLGIKYSHEPGIISGNVEHFLHIGMHVEAVVLMPAAAATLKINDQFIGGAAFHKESELGIIRLRLPGILIDSGGQAAQDGVYPLYSKSG